MYKPDKISMVLFKLMVLQGILLLLFLSVSIPVLAQKTDFLLNFQTNSEEENKIIKKYGYQSEHKDSLGVLREIDNFIVFLNQNEGFFFAKVQKINFADKTADVQIELGKRFFFDKVSKGNLNKVIADEIGFKEKNYTSHFSLQKLALLQKKIIAFSENNGYPFATVRLDSFQMEENKVRTSLKYEAGPKIIIDTFRIEGTAKIKQLYLNSYLKIREKDLFDQSKINQIPKFLQKLPYLRMYKNPSVTFALGRAYINLFINQRKANQIDGIIGFLPNEQKQGELLLTGEFNLQLRNLFYSGKTFKAEWQRIKPESQTLNLEYEHPNIFKTSFDLKLNFNLLKQDTTFLNIERQLFVYYNSPNANRFNVHFNLRTSRVLSSTFLTATNELPNILDINLLLYGVGYERSNTDNYFYPRKGQKFNISLDIGTKTINKNPFLKDSLYNGLNLSTTQFSIKADYQYYLPVGLRSTVTARLQLGHLVSENVFQNDLFRLGGLSSIRGHNQNVFFASSYLINTLEYRFFLEEESYFLLFYDQSFYQSKTYYNFEEDYPYGVGLGISFAVKAGIFNLVYALGGSRDESLSFGRSKIHFGLVSRF